MSLGFDDDYRVRARERIAAVASLRAEIDEELAETAVEDAKSQEKFESDARAGALGVEWQRVQQRIDLGQTTLADVMSGADDTQAARALRDRAESRLTELHDELVIEEESDETDDDPLTQVTQMQRDLAARLEELRIRTEEWDERR